ncbi:MAG: gliding motility lipoprotein GldD [Bacteroidales bacterium]|nr:gliding motility lipoprotein GldD [Bacteroidales bacterium]MBN2763809.1 gliding motility lipoprotein GldD [Bacteroidales bacterium]
MRNRHNIISFIWTILTVLVLFPAVSCKKTYTPKPRAYFRIDLPEKAYRQYSTECPFTFEYPVYGEIVEYTGKDAEPCWNNIEFSQFKGKIHLTYKPVNENLADYIEDIRMLAYKHIIKADDIIDKPFYYPDRHVYGILYDIRGNTASSVSFFATDSLHNFLSGSLYFGVPPNIDSIAPVLEFLKEDILHLIETLKWK